MLMTSHELLGFMSPGLSNDILNYAHEAEKELYQAALQAVADARRVRPVFLLKQPRTQRHALMVSVLGRPSMEMAAANLLRGWLVKKHPALLVEFLDALGIPHQQGVLETVPAEMDDAKLKAAVDQLLSKHPQELVAVYLHAFCGMDGCGWPNLRGLIESDPRLAVGA